MIRNAVSEILNGSIIFNLRPPHSGSATYNRTSTTNTNLPAPGNHLSCWIDTGGYLEHTTGGFGFWTTMLLTPRLVALLGIVLALCTLRVSDAKEFRTTSVSSSPQWWPPLHPPGDRPWKATDIASEPHESLTKTSSIATVASLCRAARRFVPRTRPQVRPPRALPPVCRGFVQDRRRVKRRSRCGCWCGTRSLWGTPCCSPFDRLRT